MRNFVGYINVVSENANRWVGKEVEECEIPDYSKDNLALYKDTLMEAVAETSEEFMERYFGGETFTEMKSELHCARTSLMAPSYRSVWVRILCAKVHILCWMTL